MAYDLIVAGAGLAGLTAAYRCAQDGKKVLILEARDRVGGRTYTITETRGGVTSHFDLGAHFIGDEEYQASVWDLAAELGLTPFKQYEGPEDVRPSPDKYWAGEGANLQVFGIETAQPSVEAYIGTTIPPSDPGKAYIVYLEQLSQSVWLDDPAKTQNADGLDAMSVWDWVCTINLPGYGAAVAPPNWTGATYGNAPNTFRDLTRMLCRVGFSTEPENISMLWLLFYVKSSGGLARFQSLRWPIQGAQGYRLTEGAQSIATSLIDKILAYPDCKLEMNQKVTGVNDNGTSVTVTTATGESFEGRKSLIAMAPALNANITFNPPMPPARQKAVTSMASSHMIMTFVTFDMPFWRTNTTKYTKGTVNGLPIPAYNISEYGLSGDALVTDGDVVWVMDNTAAEGTAALFAFIVGEAAVKLAPKSKAEREQVVLKTMGHLFGDADVASNNPSYYELDWNKEEFSQGCPAGHFLPNTFLDCVDGVLLSRLQTQQTGNVYFASTEAATISNGYMAGAVWSGEQVAKDILGALGSAVPQPFDWMARKMGMLDCVNQIMQAIEMQIPMLEWPALTDDCAFKGPGGDVLPTAPEGKGSYVGQEGTIEFYTRLGFFFTLTKVKVLNIAINPGTGFAFCNFTVDGVANATGQPFQSIYATMVFEFTDPSQGAPLIKADRLIMDTVLIDSLGMPHPPKAPDQEPPTGEARRALLEKRADALGVWLQGGADATQDAAYDYTVVYGAGGDILPRGPFYGQAGVRKVFEPVVGQNSYVFSSVEIKSIALDSTELTMMIVYAVSGESSGNGDPFETQLVVNMRVAHDPDMRVVEFGVSMDGTLLG